MPKYKVVWLQCGRRIKLSFFRPEAALELAIIIVRMGHPLLYVEQ